MFGKGLAAALCLIAMAMAFSAAPVLAHGGGHGGGHGGFGHAGFAHGGFNRGFGFGGFYRPFYGYGGFGLFGLGYGLGYGYGFGGYGLGYGGYGLGYGYGMGYGGLGYSGYGLGYGGYGLGYGGYAGYGYGVSGNGGCGYPGYAPAAAPAPTVPALPPASGDGTYPYDGSPGPQLPPPRTVRLNGNFVSAPRSAYQFLAYGESAPSPMQTVATNQASGTQKPTAPSTSARVTNRFVYPAYGEQAPASLTTDQVVASKR